MLFPILDRNNICRLINPNFKRALIGAEVGVQKGTYSEQLLRTITFEKFYCIDPWKHLISYDDPANVTDTEHESRFQHTKRRLEIFGDKVEYVRKTSEEAMLDFPDEYFDFIYIDADHSYNAVLTDVYGWWPKIKPGGFFAGHDYTNFLVNTVDCGVKRAVNEFVAEHSLKLVTTRDKWPTWIVQKE